MPLFQDQTNTLMEIAKSAYADAVSETDPRQQNYKSVVAFVFAHAALTAFVNALPIRIRSLNNDPKPMRPDLMPVALGLEGMHEKSGLDERIKEIPGFLRQAKFDKGKDELKQVIELIEVRNELLHLKAVNALDKKDIDDLERHGVLKPLDPEDQHPLWIDRMTVDTGKWAINTVVNMVLKINGFLKLSGVADRYSSFHGV